MLALTLQEEIITISLSRNIDTSVLSISPKARTAPLPSVPPRSTTSSSKRVRRRQSQRGSDDDEEGKEEHDNYYQTEDENEDGNARAGPSRERDEGGQQAQDDPDDEDEGELPQAHTCSLIVSLESRVLGISSHLVLKEEARRLGWLKKMSSEGDYYVEAHLLSPSFVLFLASQGLNTPTPYLKVNNQVFKGKLVELIGSDLLWEMQDPRNSAFLSSLRYHLRRDG